MTIERYAAAVATLEGWYRARLDDGWSSKPLSRPPEEHDFVLTAGNPALAIDWLDSMPDGRVPVIIMR